MIWSLVNWLGVLLAISGTLCISALRRVYLGHLFWFAANVLLILHALHGREWAYLFMFSVYLVITIIGIRRWKP
jgi:hypothetical protein